MIKSISELKSRFLRGMKPTQEDFANLIDSFVHRQDTSAVGKLSITKEQIVVTSDTNILESNNDYSNSDTLECVVNGVDRLFVFEFPNIFTFADGLRESDVLIIKKYSIVTV